MSSKSLARLGGLLYLIIIVLGLFEEIGVRSRVTAANLKAMESLWRIGIASEFVLLICATILTMIFYVLFRPVSERLALLAVFFNLVFIALEAVAALHLVAALYAADPASSIRAHSQGFGAALLFFGCECIILGILIFRSHFLPRLIGVLMAIAGVCYLVNSFALILAPHVASRLFPAILVPAFIGEASFCLWLLVKGVSEHDHVAQRVA